MREWDLHYIEEGTFPTPLSTSPTPSPSRLARFPCRTTSRSWILLLEQTASGELDLERAKTLEKNADRIGARPLGLLVADAIDRNLGRARLVECIGNPFEFFSAYADAADRDPILPPESETARGALRALSARFARD